MVSVGEVGVHVRQLTFRGATDVDAAVTYVRERVVPVLNEQHGFRGVSVSADPENGVLAVLLMWAAEEDLQAGDSATDKAWGGAVKVVGEVVTVETYEQTTEAIARAPVAGNVLVVTRLTVDPSSIDDQVAFFERDVLPVIEAQPGFCSMRTMVNRCYGRCVVGIVWQDRRSLDAYLVSMPEMRDIARERGIRFDELSARDIVLFETG
jgi:hypothetical protein